MDMVRPGQPAIGGPGGPGVVVAGGEENLSLQLLQGVVQDLHGLRPGPLPVEEVPRQKEQVGLALPDGVGQPGQQGPLFLPPLRRLIGGEGLEGGV